VVSTVATVVIGIICRLLPLMSWMLVWVQVPVVSGLHEMTQLAPSSAVAGVRGDGWASTEEANARARTETTASIIAGLLDAWKRARCC
jgi:hypothetical protein